MKKNQKLMPKYWIGHDIRDGDVFLETASKDYRSTLNKMPDKFDPDDLNIKIDLFEINIIIEIDK